MQMMMNIPLVTAEVTELGNQITKLNKQYSDIWRSINNCPLSGSSRWSVIRNLKSNANLLQNEIQSLRKLKKGLTDSIALYRKYEVNISNQVGGKCFAKAIESSAANNSAEIDKEEQNQDWRKSFVLTDLLYNIVGKAGIISAVNIVTAWVKNDDKGKAAIDSLKALNSVIGSIAGTVAKVSSPKNTTAAWKYLIGVNTENTSSFTEAWVKQFKQDLGFGDVSATTANKVKIATKWAGYTLTVAGDAYQNYREYQDGGITVSRAVGETIIQSAVDIGIGATATAAATAGLAALGVTAAPALAIAVAAVGITWIAESCCKCVTKKVTGTEKGIGETVADLTFDYLIPTLQKNTTSIISSANDAVKSVGEFVKRGLSSSWRGITQAFA